MSDMIAALTDMLTNNRTALDAAAAALPHEVGGEFRQLRKLHTGAVVLVTQEVPFGPNGEADSEDRCRYGIRLGDLLPDEIEYVAGRELDGIIANSEIHQPVTWAEYSRLIGYTYAPWAAKDISAVLGLGA